ncbi:plasmid replication initiator TrfA [Piscirickettsia salmonis]|uniref:plasmid replication initiator TrfA n=1 Tax=Piscirickettsia salmonis TaxID=1238 RepID=UPI0007C91421|nr:plasmid replication initiator TrfA [Piscirickettsia salmonis]OAJ35345.1 Replication initiator protein A [Piscirickettsiaceae bacterium NZ-RLO1]QGP57402.1 Protein involved in initiation of plasmid replication [Piscirickettsia salmonis]QGP66997.1 Protein involved in initiation of plasmid replication [Piscirickettsia salmonis]
MKDIAERLKNIQNKKSKLEPTIKTPKDILKCTDYQNITEEWLDVIEKFTLKELKNHKKLGNFSGDPAEFLEKMKEVLAKHDKQLINDDTKHPFPSKYPKSQGEPLSNILCRSSLFGAVKPGSKKEHKINKIDDDWPTMESWKDYTVQYLGFQLDQTDLDIFLSCISACKDIGFGERIHISGYQLLKKLGLGDSKSNYKRLDNGLKRLSHGKIKIKHKDYSYEDSFITGLVLKENTENGLYSFRLSVELAPLFKSGYYTAHSIADRKKLNGNLAKWIYSYLRTHKINQNREHEISLSKLHALCGSTTSELRKFKLKLKEAMQSVSEINGISLRFEKNKQNEDKAIFFTKKQLQ